MHVSVHGELLQWMKCAAVTTIDSIDRSVVRMGASVSLTLGCVSYARLRAALNGTPASGMQLGLTPGSDLLLRTKERATRRSARHARMSSLRPDSEPTLLSERCAPESEKTAWIKWLDGHLARHVAASRASC